MSRRDLEPGSARRRRRLWQGLLIGGAAVGLPALANVLVARRTRPLAGARWGRPERYAWSGGEVSFQRLGAGEPILLLHSFGPGHDSEQWREAAERLAKNHEVFALDLLGWGRSEKPDRTYDGEVYLRLVSDFIEDVIGGRVTVVGSGQCGAYAVQIAVDQPQKVLAVGAVSPTGLGTAGHEPDLKDALLQRCLRLPLVGTSVLNLLTSRTTLTQHLRRLVHLPERADAAWVDHHYRSSHQPGAHVALSAWFAGYLNHSVESALPRLSRPLWLAWGRKAVDPPVTTADLWLQQAPHTVLEVFERSAALPHREEADRFADRLESFLATVPEGDAVAPA